jgi:DNA polymerase elongation subunit (family B)
MMFTKAPFFLLDIEWYLNQQIHPPVARLCSPIAGTDASHLAECLGNDQQTSSY